VTNSTLPVDSVIIDGEAVCLRENGRPDFHALRSKRTCADAYLIAFDLLKRDGRDLRRNPLNEGRRELEALLLGAPDALLYPGCIEGACRPRPVPTRVPGGPRGDRLKTSFPCRFRLPIVAMQEAQHESAGGNKSEQ
jgi:hypothetical protein